MCNILDIIISVQTYSILRRCAKHQLKSLAPTAAARLVNLLLALCHLFNSSSLSLCSINAAWRPQLMMRRCPVLVRIHLQDIDCVASLPVTLIPLLHIRRAHLPAHACCEGSCIPPSMFVCLCLEVPCANTS